MARRSPGVSGSVGGVLPLLTVGGSFVRRTRPVYNKRFPGLVIGFLSLNSAMSRSICSRLKCSRIRAATTYPSGLVVSVMTHDAPLGDVFDERRVGLDHLAFRVADRHELERWVSHLDAKGVAHSGIVDMGFGPTLVFRDPDNIQLELFVHPTADG